ncbi:MAG TPA: dihydrodipicolinate synthase family protein [Acidimicrobiales bacterium]|nr:dihydrodipicolinate synthase family protein [Acidimicrobiales bacterium]
MIEPRPGVYTVVPTPFTADEGLDETSLERLLGELVARGVDGVIVLGVLGEAPTLYADERERVVRAAVRAVGGAAAVIVGASHASAVGTRALLERAASLGADGVMVSPPRIARSDAGRVLDYMRLALAEPPCPVLLQDHPASSGTLMSAATIVAIADECPSVRWVKVEDPPSARKVLELRAAAGDRLHLLGGLGALSLLDELEAGSGGTMTGFAAPEALVAIVGHHVKGDRVRAAEEFARWLPLIVTESAEEIGLSVRKWIYYRRGWIDTPLCRTPSSPVPETVRARVDEQLRSFALLEREG